MDKAAFAMASRTIPVRDELVVSLDDIFPVLKSGEGIPVVKHTKRGQSDHRRLRLDTDDSTLEVFRRSTTASYLNRKISNRRYNLSMLEEVGPATSVPGGQGGKAATPGRTVVFVFRNRNLYVTVETRDVCAALVALFRPAGAAPQALLLSDAITAQTSEDGDSASAPRRRNASPSSPSSEGRSVRTERLLAGAAAAAAAPRRPSDKASSARGLLEHQPRPGGDREQVDWADLEVEEIGRVESNGRVSSRRSRDRGVGASGARRGSSGRPLEARLRRSASETAGTARFDATSTSSSDEEGGMGAVVLSTTTTSSSVERSQQRSPKSTSESPDAIMRSRMVGFGSTDMAMSDEKPKRAGRTSSIRPRWPARFTDFSEKKQTPVAAAVAATPAAAATTVSSRLKTTDLAVEDNAGTEEDVGVTSMEGKEHHVSKVRKLGGPASVTSHDQSPLAVRVEDRLNFESLRRPPSAPSNVVAIEDKESSTLEDTPPVQHRPMPRPANSSPPETHARTITPFARRPSRVRTTPQAQAAAVSQQQNGDEFDFAYPRRLIPMVPAVYSSPAAAAIPPQSVPAKIPQLGRPPVADVLQQQQDSATKATAAAVVNAHDAGGTIDRDSSYESSLSPTPPQQRPLPVITVSAVAAGVTSNGTHAGGAVVRGGGALLKQGYNRSSSVDSLEVEDPYHRHGESPASFGNAVNYSEGDGASSGQASASQDLRADQPVEPGGRGAQEPGKGRHRDAKQGYNVVPVSGMKGEPTAVSQTSRDLPLVDERHASVVKEFRGRAGGGAGTGEEAATRAVNTVAVDRIESFATSRTDSSGPPSFENAVTRLTIQTDHSHDEYAALSEAGTSVRNNSTGLPFAPTPAAVAATAAARAVFNSRSSRSSKGSRGSYDRRGSGGTDCISPGSPPGGAVGEVRASTFHAPAGGRTIPRISGLHLNGGGPRDQYPQGPSGFEELWAVMEPAWDINSSFGASFAPKAMLLGDIYESMRNFQAAVASVCVRACGPVLGEVCGRCARAWAVLISMSVEDMVLCQDVLRKIHSGVVQLIDVVQRYEASAVVRRFALPLIGVGTAWDELLAAGEGGDMQEPCQRIEEAIAQLPKKKPDGGERGGGGGGTGSSSKGGRRLSCSRDLRLPPCPSCWAKGQFDQLTPNGLADVLTLLHEPARFAELAELVTRASDVGPANREYSFAWDCVRRVEGPALGRELRRALSATLVAAGELLPLPRVPPPPPAYVAREELTEQIEATILHPFLPLGIAGIGGASGSGKTVLASTVVRDATVRCRFGDRVFWLHAGKGADRRLVSVLQALADTVYAWLTDGKHAASSSASPSKQRRNSGGGDAGGGVLTDPNLREPVRFRDQDQAVNYLADLCRGPLLAGLRCLVVLDDVHEREVVDALWKSGCQLLVTSPVEGLLQAVGAEATMAAPFSLELAREVTTKAVGEEIFCEEANKLVDMCRGCPLALAMSGAAAQAVLSGGNDAREYRKPGLATPRTNLESGRGEAGEGGGREVTKIKGSSWSLSTLAAPVGAWVEQVVVGTSGLPPTNRNRMGSSPPSGDVRRPASVPEGNIRRAAGASGNGTAVGAAAAAAAAAAASRLGPEATAWVNLARRVDDGLAALKQSRGLYGLLAEAGPEGEMPVRELIAVLTELALQEADRILGGSGWAAECYLSFALVPEGVPLPPPALEEFWRMGNDSQGGEEGGGGNANGSESHHHCPPAPVEVFEALRLVGRAGGGEGADGLIPHGLQRTVVVCMAQRHPEMMQKMVRRRVQMLSRISSLVGTFDDDCWGLRAAGGADAGAGARIAATRSGGDEGVVDVIPSGLLVSRRPGPPTHGYGGFSRYDYLVVSWEALPRPHTLASAASSYVSSVRASCQAAVAAAKAASAQNGDGASASSADADFGGVGWAAARALASAADLEALAGRRSEAIPAYVEACAILAAEAARTAKVAVVQNKERAARNSHHKVASMMQELAVLLAQFGREAPAIRLLQRAVEMHLSALEASGVLVPHVAGGNEHRSGLNGSDTEAVAATAAADENAHGRGADITFRAVMDDVRPVSSRLFLQPSARVGQHPASGRGGDSSNGGSSGSLPAFGRLDVVSTCVGDLGLVLACTRSLQQEQKIDESVQLAEKVYPVLKEILGADHTFTKTALAVFAGQAIVDECFAQGDVDGGSGGGHPALPSPASRRRLARSYGGRGGGSTAGIGGGGGGAGGLGGGGGGGGSGAAAQNTTGSSLVASTLSDLSLPPSPLPEEYYARYSSSANGAKNMSGSHGVSGGGGGGHMGRRSSRGYSINGSASSGTEGDDGEDTDSRGSSGALGGPRRAGPVGGVAYSRVSFPTRDLNRCGVPQGWEQSELAVVGGGGAFGRGTLEPASSRMQEEFYFQHRTRRARAHAFLITAATRARLKNANRAEAGLFLRDLGRLAGATSGRNGRSNGGRELSGAGLSPNGTPQIERLTRRR